MRFKLRIPQYKGRPSCPVSIKTRTHLSSYLAVFGLVILLFGCIPQNAKPTPPTKSSEPLNSQKLRVWSSRSDDPTQIQNLFKKYTQASGIPVEITTSVGLSTITNALAGSDPPDLVILDEAESVPAWKLQNFIMPLDDLIDIAGIDINDLHPVPLFKCEMDNNHFCLPWGADTYVLYWNKDLFTKAGLDPEKPPATMDDLLQFADRLTKVDATGKLTQIGFIPDYPESHLDLYASLFGGYWVSADGLKLDLASQPVQDSFTWQGQIYSRFGTDQIVQFVSKVEKGGTSPQGFTDGKIAMMAGKEWLAGSKQFLDAEPKLNFGFAPFPYPSNQPFMKNMEFITGPVVVIPSRIKNKNLSADLLAWIMSPGIMAEECYEVNCLPTSKKAALDPRFAGDPNKKMLIALMSNINVAVPIYTPVNPKLNLALGMIEDQVLYSGRDPIPLLQAANTKYQSELDQWMQPP